MSTDARLSTSLPGHPKTKKLVRRLGPQAGWSLVCLILWACANRPDGNLEGMSAEDIEAAAEWTGAPGAFAKEVSSVGLLDGGLASGLWKPGRASVVRFGRVCSKVWRRVRLAIFERDGWRCRYCGDTEGPFECDHVLPISRGGSNDESNLATACRRCNRSKRAKLLTEWRAA